MRSMLCTVVALVSASLGVANAKEVPFQTPGELKSKCQAAGGLYGPPSAGGVYVCVMDSGIVVACGGKGEDAKTCETGDAPQRVNKPRPVLRDLTIDKKIDVATPD